MKLTEYSIVEAEKIRHMKALDVYSYLLAAKRLNEIEKKKNKERDLENLVKDSLHSEE